MSLQGLILLGFQSCQKKKKGLRIPIVIINDSGIRVEILTQLANLAAVAVSPFTSEQKFKCLNKMQVNHFLNSDFGFDVLAKLVCLFIFVLTSTSCSCPFKGPFTKMVMQFIS